MKSLLSLFILTGFLMGCSFKPDANLMVSSMPPTQMRMLQTRQFSQTDQALVLEAVIKTLSSLDFMILKVDEQDGLIEAIQVANDHIVQVNVVSTPIGNKGSSIRINGRFDQSPINSWQAYQRFFEALSHNLS